MPFAKKTTEENTKVSATYNVEVTKVILTDSDKRVLFNAKVNGISVDGFGFVEYTNKEGQTGFMVQYPSRKFKGKDGKEGYSNVVWFPISKDLRDDIKGQIDKILEAMVNS